jgi:SAM-dependent methyltransferase
MQLEGVERWLLRSQAWRLLARRLIVPWVLAAGSLPDQGDALELGMGGGFNTQVLLRRFPAWNLRATDYDPAMVELAARRLGRPGRPPILEVADATRLRYPDSSFDVVLSILVWHHVGDWRAANREVRRVLRPNGRALIADIFGHRVFGPLERFLSPSVSYTSDRLLSDLPLAGLEVEVARMLDDGLAGSFVVKRAPDALP